MTNDKTKRDVYVVTSGEYSSYGIEAIFADREMAELFAAKDEDWRVEVYRLWEHEPASLRVHRMAVRSSDWAREYYGGETEATWSTVEWEYKVNFRRYRRPKIEALADTSKRWRVHGEGADLEAVRKAVYDKVAELRAKQEGIG